MVIGATVCLAAPANALTAAEVRKNMSDKERGAYVAGLVEGLAQARWIKDKPDKTGMKCIYDWHFQPTTRKVNRLETLMDKYPNTQMSGIIFVLAKKACGW